METSLVIANLGALATTALGGLGLFAPQRAARFTNITPNGALGISEIRATYGGLFAALGLSCLVSQWDPIYLAAGIAWVGAALGRSWSVAIDRNFEAENLGGILFELAIGLCLLAPRLAAL